MISRPISPIPNPAPSIPVIIISTNRSEQHHHFVVGQVTRFHEPQLPSAIRMYVHRHREPRIDKIECNQECLAGDQPPIYEIDFVPEV